MRRTIKQDPDNLPDLEDYLEAKGTVFVLVTMDHPIYARSWIRDLEVNDRPPTFKFEDEGQLCFMANVNGGDSQLFYNLNGLMSVLKEEFVKWLSEGLKEEFVKGVVKGNDEEGWTSL